MRKLYKEKLIRTYISYFFIVLITGIIAIIIYHHFKLVQSDDSAQNSNTNNLHILTDNEVSVEREKFLPLLEKPKFVSDSTSSGTTTYYATGKDAEQAKSMVLNNETYNHTNNQTEYTDLTKTSEITLDDGSIIRSYSSPGGTLSAVNEYPSEVLSPLVIEGSIIDINTDKKTISVALLSGNGMGTIQFNSDTKILINNKPIDFSALRIADTIRAEGFGNTTSNILIKTNITIITGFHQLIPTI